VGAELRPSEPAAGGDGPGRGPQPRWWARAPPGRTRAPPGDTSGAAAFKNVMAALRAKFGSSALVTAAVTADGSAGGKIEAADYAGAAQYVNWYNVMSYDFFGAWDAQGPTAPHSPLTSYSGIPKAGFTTADAIAKYKAIGVPAGKLLVGIGFYGRGWTGVTQDAPGGTTVQLDLVEVRNSGGRAVVVLPIAIPRDAIRVRDVVAEAKRLLI